jgi:sugar lactone lactonase YvrE
MKIFIVLFVLSSFLLEAQQSQPFDLIGVYQKAMVAKNEKNYTEYLTLASQLSNHAPTHYGIRYLLAEAQALTGDLKAAKTNLLAAAKSGITIDLSKSTSFDTIKDSPEYKQALGFFDRNKQPSGNSQIAFKIPQKDLIAEGIAYDPVSRSFFVSSTYRRKIVEVDATGKSRDFITDNQDGIWGVVGMEVDGKRRHLWANSGNLEQNMQMKYPEPETLGHTAIHKYDLTTRKLIKKYVLAVKGEKHFFNDLSISKAGDVYITDTDEGAVYKISAEKDELKFFVKPEGMSYPNGIALSGDDKFLYVAHLQGISVIDLKSKEVKLLKAPESTATTSIDGMLFYENSLIANQALTGVERVARFHLSSDPARIERLEVLQVNHPTFVMPTTGVVAGDSFYYIANSQLRSFDETGKIFPDDKLQETIILKVKV